MIVWDKRSSLLRKCVNYSRNKLHNIGPSGLIHPFVIHPSVCPLYYPSVRPSASLSVYPSLRPSFCPSICSIHPLSICPSVRLITLHHLSLCLYVCLFVIQSVRPSVHLFVCLSQCPSIYLGTLHHL
jgi:hypothetical protein